MKRAVSIAGGIIDLAVVISDKDYPVRALLVYPEFPDAFWSFKHALKFIFKKASSPPLGLLTVAAMLPESWQKILVDMNVQALRDDDLRWADLVCITPCLFRRNR